MHTLLALLTAALLTVAAASCEKSGNRKPGEARRQPAASADDAQPAAAPNPAIAFMDTLASAIEANVDDCDKMAAAVDKVFADNARFVALIEEMRIADDETREKYANSPAHADFEEDHGKERSPLLRRIAAADPCMAKHAGLATALGRLGKRATP